MPVCAESTARSLRGMLVVCGPVARTAVGGAGIPLLAAVIDASRPLERNARRLSGMPMRADVPELASRNAAATAYTQGSAVAAVAL